MFFKKKDSGKSSPKDQGGTVDADQINSFARDSSELAIDLGLDQVKKIPEEAVCSAVASEGISSIVGFFAGMVLDIVDNISSFILKFFIRRRLQQILPVKQNDLVLLYNEEGVQLMRERKFDESITIYDKALQCNSKFHWAIWYNKGVVLYNLQRYAEAMVCFDKSLYYFPNYSEALGMKGTILLLEGKDEEALSYFDKALQINRNETNVLRGKAEILSKKGKPFDALRCNAKALKILAPKSPIAYCAKGLIYATESKHRRAIHYFNKALKKDPKNMIARASKARSLYFRRRYKRAISLFDEVIKEQPNSIEDILLKGDSLHHIRKNKDALLCLDTVLQIDPNSAAAWRIKGHILAAHFSRYDEALVCYDKVLQIEPNNEYVLREKSITVSNKLKKQEKIASNKRKEQGGKN